MHRPRNPLFGRDAGCRMPVAVVCRVHAKAANRALQELAVVCGVAEPRKGTKTDQLQMNRGSSAGRAPAHVWEPVNELQYYSLYDHQHDPKDSCLLN